MTTMAGLNQSFSSNGTSNWTSMSQSVCGEMGGVFMDAGCDTPHYYPDVFFFSCLLFLGTFLMSLSLKEFKTMPFFTTRVRSLCRCKPAVSCWIRSRLLLSFCIYFMHTYFYRTVFVTTLLVYNYLLLF